MNNKIKDILQYVYNFMIMKEKIYIIMIVVEFRIMMYLKIVINK